MFRIVTERQDRSPAVQPVNPVVKEEVTATLTLNVPDLWSVGQITVRHSGALSLVQILQIPSSHWSRYPRYCPLICGTLGLTMLALRSMP